MSDHPAALTPEYRAAMALEDIEGNHIDLIARDRRDGEFRVNHRAVAVIAACIRSAVMAEREACARVAETTTANGDGSGLWPYGYGMAQAEIAEAIRARPTETDHDR